MRILINTVLLTCKRCMSRLSFWIGILLLPFLIWGIAVMTSDTITDWNVALYTEEGGLAQSAIDELCTQDSFFHFYQCESLEDMQKDIRAKKAECGFFFQQGFEEAFYEGRLKEQIMIYFAPSTIADKAARETVFSAILKQANQVILNNFLKETTGAIANEALYQELYQKYARNGNLFQFQYEELTGEEREIEQNSFLLSPVRGIFAIYLWAIGLFSVLAIYDDEKNGIYPLLKKSQRIALKWCTVWIPVLAASLTGLAGLAVSGMIYAPLTELCYVIVYGIAITVFSITMQKIWSNPGYYSCFVTLLLTAGVVFCPVFISIGQFLPRIAWVQKIFLPDYYLEIFLQNDKTGMIFAIIVTGILYEILRFVHRD